MHHLRNGVLIVSKSGRDWIKDAVDATNTLGQALSQGTFSCAPAELRKLCRAANEQHNQRNLLMKSGVLFTLTV